jgi:hypothetical protein
MLEWRGLSPDSDQRLRVASDGTVQPDRCRLETLDIGRELEVDRAGDLHACKQGEMERGRVRWRERERNSALAGRESDREQAREGEEREQSRSATGRRGERERERESERARVVPNPLRKLRERKRWTYARPKRAQIHETQCTPGRPWSIQKQPTPCLQ